MERELTKEEREDRAKAKAMEVLVQYPEWKFYQQLLNNQLKSWQGALMKQNTSIGGVLENEYAKGAVFAFTVARDLPGVTIDMVKSIRPGGTADDEE